MIVHSEYPVGEPRVRRQAEAAAAAGWDVHVLALATEGAPPVERSEAETIHRSAVRRERCMTMRGLVREYGRFFLAALVQCLRDSRYDVVVVANPPDFLVFATIPQLVRGSRSILDVHDLMTDLFAVRLGVQRGDLAYRVLAAMERVSARFVDRVMTVHKPYSDEIAKRSGGRVQPVVVMNSADNALFTKKSLVTDGPCVLFYHGSLFERYGVLDVLHAFAVVERQCKEVHLWLAGDGDARGELLRLRDGLALADKVWISDGMLPAERITGLLAKAHIGLVPNQPNELNKYALSTKLFEYVATGIPVVCAGLPTLRQHFADDELLFFHPGDVHDMAEKLRFAVEHPGEMAVRAERAYTRYEREYSWPRQKQVFLDLLSECKG